MINRLVLGVLFLALLLLFGIGVLRHESLASDPQTQDFPRTAFVHLFEWQWEDIAQECEGFLGPHGFAAVQISPPNEHAIVRQPVFPWWQRYQPVSYQLVSRSGDRAQLIQMIQRCHRAGVKVYADAVINHMSGQEVGIGSGGTPFRKYAYPGLYQPSDFHSCRHNIRNYLDRNEVMTCQLVGLPDLRTNSPYVQDQIANYLSELVNLGIDGLRIDAAKHMDTRDIGQILALANRKHQATPYIYQEVIDPGYEAVKKSEYYPNGAVIEFEYGRLLGAKFLGLDGQNLSQLNTLGETWGLMPPDKAVVFVDNHDKQRGHGGGGTYLTYKDGKLYDLATIFMLAFPYGYPQIMSSYAFTDSEQGPPADANGNTHPVYQQGTVNCFTEWICEHRRQAIAPMVHFRNHTASYPGITNWWTNGSNQIAFGRGDRGFVVINRESTPLTHTFQTSLAPGRYCNVLRRSLDAPAGECPEEATITVADDGQATISINAMDAVALHLGAKRMN